MPAALPRTGSEERPFRVIDTGIRQGRANIAFDAALIEARKEGRIPDTVRFLRFRPSALIGRHQYLSQEIRVAYCKAHGIEIGRRITGGGGLYLDEGQIGWELVFDRKSLGFSDLGEASRRICEAAAAGLSRLGVPARYRPRNDIEVEGRKLSGTGGYFDGDILFYQGTLLIDFNPSIMTAVLNIPAETLEKRALAAAGQRIVTLRELLGDRLPDLTEIYKALLGGFAEGLGIAPYWGRATPEEEALADRLYREEIGTEAFVAMLDAPPRSEGMASASLTRPGGSVRADIRLEGLSRDRIREVLLTGDFFATPPRVILDLEAALRGLAVAEAGSAVEAYFARNPADLLSLAPGDFREVVEAALCCR
jgi:lipoate---protein ligase